MQESNAFSAYPIVLVIHFNVKKFDVAIEVRDDFFRAQLQFPVKKLQNQLAILLSWSHHGVVFANRAFSLGAIILAAGNSSRMGRPKMLLPWNETTVLGHLIATWTDLASQIAVVYAATDAAIEAELNHVQFSAENRIINPDAARGMFSSIQRAAEWNGWKPELTHWAVVLGDQPHLRRSSLDAVVAFAKRQRKKICQPSRGGSARHPVLLPKTAFAKLDGSDEKNLKEFLQLLSAEVSLIELDDPGLDLDIDHPADYAKAQRLSGGK